MCLGQYLEIGKSLLTPIIAIVTVYIAWQQWRANKLKLNLERYDRRLKVYEAVREMLSLTFRSTHSPGSDTLLKFYRETSQADFLFGPDITDYIEEIYDHGVKLQEWSDQFRDFTQPMPADYDSAKVSAGIFAERKWLSHQFDTAKQKFKDYMDLNDISYFKRLQHNVRRILRQLRESRDNRCSQ